MMKKTYIYPNTEVVLLHADASLCQSVAGASEHGDPNNKMGTLGKQRIPGVFVVDW